MKTLPMKSTFFLSGGGGGEYRHAEDLNSIKSFPIHYSSYIAYRGI